MDLELIENGNGGEIIKTAKDVSVIHGLQNMPYLALFGGNVKASTTKRVKNEQAFDWWGNSLLMRDTPALQYNSLTERTLQKTPLTSSGRILIEQTVLKDLEFMKAFAKVAVSVAIIATDKVRIVIKLQDLENKFFLFVWDATKMELIDKKTGGGIASEESGIFDFTFDEIFN
jgi:hypothetical protein